MAESDPSAEEPPDRVPVTTEQAQPRRSAHARLARVLPWTILLAAALMGIVVGTTLGLRSGSLFPGQATAGAGARPTIVIGSAPSPSPAVALASSPSPVGSPIAQAPSASVERTQEYVVEAGDTMRSIAQQVYGDPELWPRIYDANRDVIGPDPDNLQVGMRLKIPPS